MCVYVCINDDYYLVCPRKKNIDSAFCAYVTRTVVMLVRNLISLPRER